MVESVERWWVIREDVILEALRACHSGEDPSLILLELTANSEQELIDPEEIA